jgi:hypothetical protein
LAAGITGGKWYGNYRVKTIPKRTTMIFSEEECYNKIAHPDGEMYVIK